MVSLLSFFHRIGSPKESSGGIRRRSSSINYFFFVINSSRHLQYPPSVFSHCVKQFAIRMAVIILIIDLSLEYT